MGVCCIVFDIDGMLLEKFFSNISCFLLFFAFHAISNIEKKMCVKKKFGGGG